MSTHLLTRSGIGLFFRIPKRASFTPLPGPEFSRRAMVTSHSTFAFLVMKSRLALIPLMEVKSFFTGRRGVCLPFSDFCAPLLFDDCEPDVVVANLSALALEHDWKHFEIRSGNWLNPARDQAVEYLGHTLDLKRGAEELFAGFSSSVRRAIRKAEESKLSVEISRSQESVTEFYRLHVQTRRRHGLPPQPFSFFRHIYDEVIRKGAGFVVRASLESRSVAAAIFLQFGRDGDLQVRSVGGSVTGDPGQQPCHVGRHSLSRGRRLRIFALRANVARQRWSAKV